MARSIELQDSAAPYHDWNERITVECYGPNAASRILDARGRIERSSTTTRASASTSGPRCCPGSRSTRPRVRRDRARRRAQPPALLRARLGPGPGLQPHDHAPGQCARPAHPDHLGAARLRAPLRPPARGHVAARDGGRLRDPGASRRAGYQVHRCWPRTRQPAAGPLDRQRHWQDVAGGWHRPHAALPVQRLPGGVEHQLFFYDGPISGRGLRAPAGRGEALAGRLTGRSRRSATGPSSSTSPPTARPTGTTTATARWRCRMRSSTSMDHNLAELVNYGGTWRRTRPSWEAEIIEQIPPGAARTASSAGERTAAAIRAGTRAGTRRGADRCATRSTGCVMKLAPRFEREAGSVAHRPMGGAGRVHRRHP